MIVFVFVIVFVFMVVVIVVVMPFFEVFVNQLFKRFDGFLVDGVAADLDIVVAAPESVEMKSHVARGAFDADQGIVLGANGVMALLDDKTRFFRQALGNPIVDDIHDAADGAAAVKQGRRPANDLQAFRQRGVNGIGMVGTDAGSIDGSDPVLQDFYAVGGLASDHGKTDSRAEGGVGDADFVLERIAKAVADFLTQRLAGQYSNRHCRVRLRFLESSGHYDFYDLIFDMAGFFLRERAAGIADRQRQTDGG